MATRLITTREVLYDNRSHKWAKIMFEMLPPIKQGDNYIITVVDHVVIEIGDNKSFRALPEPKQVPIPISKINDLFDTVSVYIPTETPYDERQELVYQYAFLHYVQHDIIEVTNKLIYGLEPEDFEIFQQ